MLNLPITIHGLYARVPGITSLLPWKRPFSSLKKAKSLRLARGPSGTHRLRTLTRDPSIPLRGAIRLPPLTPRKRAHPVQRQPTIVRQRAAALRGKRVHSLKALNARKKVPVTASPLQAQPVPKRAQRARQPVPQPVRNEPVAAAGPNQRVRAERAQSKFDAFCDQAQGTRPKARTFEDTVFVEQMAKMNFRHRFVTERFFNRVRLEEAQDMVEDRLREQAEHDKKARELRARGKQQQQHRSQSSPEQLPQHRPQTGAQYAGPPMSTPKFYSKPPTREPPAHESFQGHQEARQTDASCGAHQECFAAGAIPTPSRPPLQGQWSLWEKAQIPLDKAYQELSEERRKEVRKAKEERRRKEEEAARAAWANEVKARAEEERIRKQTREQQAQARIRAAWEEKIRRETALAEELKAAEQQKARQQEQAALEAEIGRASRPASIPFIPPQTDDPELYQWEMYQRRWAAIKGEGVEVVPFPLRFDQLPWPLFHFQCTTISINHLSEEDISYFVLSTKRPGYERKHAKERLRHELLHYHPDKFVARVLPYVMEEERENVVAGASRVTSVLYDLLRSLPAGCA